MVAVYRQMRNAVADVDADFESDKDSDMNAYCSWQEIIFRQSQICKILKLSLCHIDKMW